MNPAIDDSGTSTVRIGDRQQDDRQTDHDPEEYRQRAPQPARDVDVRRRRAANQIRRPEPGHLPPWSHEIRHSCPPLPFFRSAIRLEMPQRDRCIGPLARIFPADRLPWFTDPETSRYRPVGTRSCMVGKRVVEAGARLVRPIHLRVCCGCSARVLGRRCSNRAP
jgi:hypothetical protein